jgi:hypothetical protein
MSTEKVTPENYTKLAGYISCRKARSTGTIISVVDGKAADLDTFGGRWYNICEDHGETVAHGSLTLAKAHAAAPEGWCEDCRAILEQKRRS